MFKVIVASYSCPDKIIGCLESIRDQTTKNYEVAVIDDATPDDGFQAGLIEQFCDDNGGFFPIFNSENQGALFSQHQGIEMLRPDDEDIIVWLDGDDKFSTPDALRTLLPHYRSGIWLTYGNYRAVPLDAGCPSPKPYPRACVADNDYRNGAKWGIQFNHLRTMKYKVYKHLGIEDFTEADGETWFHVAGDTAVKVPALELANGKYRCLSDVLVDYTSNSSLADWRLHSKEINRIHKRIFTQLPKKEPL